MAGKRPRITVDEFHALIRARRDADVLACLKESPEFSYAKAGNGETALQVAAQVLNPVLVKAILDTERAIPVSEKVMRGERGEIVSHIPTVFEKTLPRPVVDTTFPAGDALVTVVNEAKSSPTIGKTALQLVNLLMLQNPNNPDLKAIKEILEKAEEQELLELLANISMDRQSPYTQAQLANLGNSTTPYTPYTFTTQNAVFNGVNITIFTDSNQILQNVPDLMEEAKARQGNLSVDGVTPLSIAAMAGGEQPSRVEEKRQQPVKGVDGVTPLHVAALAGDKVLVDTIKSGKTDVKVTNDYGLTAGDMAGIMGRAHARGGHNQDFADKYNDIAKDLKHMEKEQPLNVDHGSRKKNSGFADRIKTGKNKDSPPILG